MQNESISLYFKNTRSDKEYHLQLQEKDGGFVVTYQNGPRGGTLSQGTKTAEPVPYGVAKKVYDKVVSEKTGKGYTPSETGKAFIGGDLEARASGVGLQLLNAIPESDVEKYLRDPDYIAQEKYDGHRRAAQGQDSGYVGINRKQLITGLPELVHNSLASKLGTQTLVDGELLGATYVIFDVLSYRGTDTRGLPVSKRLEVMVAVSQALEGEGNHVFVTKTARTEAEKRELFASLKKNRKEGIVFKKIDSLYEAGRPSSGGPQLKYKFRHSATFIVSAVSKTKRSITVCALDSETGAEISFENCGVPKNMELPAVGELVDLTYRHVFRTGGLSEPQYKGVRDDIDKNACTTAQLVYKPDEGEEGSDEE